MNDTPQKLMSAIAGSPAGERIAKLYEDIETIFEEQKVTPESRQKVLADLESSFEAAVLVNTLKSLSVEDQDALVPALLKGAEGNQEEARRVQALVDAKLPTEERARLLGVSIEEVLKEFIDEMGR